MTHSFDVEIARQHGIPAAILFDHFYITCKCSPESLKSNGTLWTKESVRVLSSLFPEMSDKTIRYALKKLVDAGLIEERFSPDDLFDRTKEYRIVERK